MLTQFNSELNKILILSGYMTSINYPERMFSQTIVLCDDFGTQVRNCINRNNHFLLTKVCLNKIEPIDKLSEIYIL